MEIEVFKTSTGKLWLDEEDIIHHECLENVDETLETAKVNVDIIEKLSKGQRRLLLLDLSKLKSVSRDAREYYSKSDKLSKILIAVATISKSRSGKVIGNFLLGFNKTTYPFKIFNSEEEAFEWLRTFKNWK